VEAGRRSEAPAPVFGRHLARALNESTALRPAVVLDWAALEGRDLPWRRTHDPWAVLVSELMLQQTQVARVIPAWHAFLARFPDPSACAAAPAAEVIRAWAGLGYNRRALNLHRAATEIVASHGGTVPASLPALLALPGVGPYTARAVLAFAYGLPHGVLDTNTARVLARAAAGRRLGRAEAQGLADDLVPAGAGWAWNQAMLDLGALVCTTSRPRCQVCPLAAAGECAWWAAGRPDPDPAAGSAGVSGRQSRFAGSDRQGRGRLVAALRRGPVPAADLAAVMGWPDEPDRAGRVAAGVLGDGLAVAGPDGALRLAE
jgi:A/G-specific adenine glycosylase